MTRNKVLEQTVKLQKELFLRQTYNTGKRMNPKKNNLNSQEIYETYI